MDGLPPEGAFWAKLSERHGVIVGWHPLPDHCADVAACCHALLEQPVIRYRLARLGGLEDLTPVQVERLSVLAALHDAGKFNIGFQNKARTTPAFTAGHVGPIIGLFDRGAFGVEAERLREALSFDELAGWCRDELALAHLLLASLAHHGRPVSPEQAQPVQRRWWQPQGSHDPFAGIADLLARTRRWFPAAYEPGGPPLPDTPAFQHAFSGLVTLADWLGSDTGFFPYTTEPNADRISHARVAARRTLAHIGLDASRARRSPRRPADVFARVSTFPPNAMQERLVRLPLPDGPSLTILESETGSGKTEAALARFLALFEAGRVDGLYFALPTRTAATQMHGRIVRAVERAFPEDARPPVLLAVPGYLAVDRLTGRRLAPFEVLWPDDNSERARYRGWAAENSKRYLAGAVVVGTIDQVLLSALVVRHAHLRATALLRHLLVVDEVHASDAYMTRLLEEVLCRHLAAGGHALLMSATLGAAARSRLLSPGRPDTPPPLDRASLEPYPAISYRIEEESPSVEAIATSGRPKEIRTNLVPAAGKPDEVARLALSAARAGARVLVVRNTVRDCVATQEALERIAGGDARALLFTCESVPAPHHARFATEDRTALDRAVEREFGKDRPPGGRVAIATQTVEQSLDLDADVLFTDLCPMDVLLQRLGRLHRHAGHPRPAGFERPGVEVLVPADRDLGRFLRRGEARGPHGLGTVYPDLLVLEATWRALERWSTLVVPAMNRELVERATHPEALEAIAGELGGPWREHWTRMSGVRFADRGLADLNLFTWDRPFVETPFPDGDLGRDVKTRLGEGDRLARLGESMASPFGQSVTTLTIPAHLAEGIPGDAEVAVDAADQSRIAFRFGTRRFVYDRLGLRPAPGSEPQEEDLADA